MAGLLDFQSKLPGLLQDDGFRLGLSLLAAAGPSATPMSAGQRIQQGLLAFQQQKEAETDQQLKRRMLEAQIGEHQAKANKQAQVQALLDRYSNPNAEGFGGAGVAGMSPSDMLTLKAYGIDPTEIVKYAGQGNKFDPGSVYQNPTTGAVMHVPKVADGVHLNPDGSASMVPGYAGATGQIEGAKQWAGVAPTLAIESGKAGIASRNDAMQVYDPARQSMVFVPRAQVLGAAQPGYATDGQMRATAQGDMGGNLADLDREISATKRSLQTPNLDASSRQLLEQHIATLQGQRAKYFGAPMQAGPSEADKAAAAAAQAGAVKQAEADVVPAQQKSNALAKFDQLLGTVDSVLKHPGLGTAVGLPGTLDPRNYIPGTDARDFAAKADQLQGQVFISAYEGLRGGGAITEVEGKKAENAIAALSRAQSSEQYRKSLGELRDVVAGARQRLLGGQEPAAAPEPTRKPVKTGTYQGRKVVQYSDGTVSYAD